MNRRVLVLGLAVLICAAGMAQAVGTGLRGEYFQFEGVVPPGQDVFDAAWSSQILIEGLDHDWPDGSVGGLRADNVAVRWAGKVEAPTTAAYTFWGRADDGVRAWVDGVQVISDWSDHGARVTPAAGHAQPSPAAATLDLVAGQQYDIVVEFYEKGGGNRCQIAVTVDSLTPPDNSVAAFSAAAIPISQLYPVVLAQDKVATTPSPADAAIIGVVDPVLQWAPSGYADSHEVVLSSDFATVDGATSGDASHLPNQHFTGGLTKGTTYYWRVIGISGTDGDSPFVGPVWSFLVSPEKAASPSPANGATNVVPSTNLTWLEGFGAQNNYVYIGTDFASVDAMDDVFTAAVSEPLYDSPTDYANGTTVYWRVDTVTSVTWDPVLLELVTVKIKGDVWSFTTIPELPIIDPNLIGWWPLDETEGSLALDYSGYGHHGTVRGAANWIEEGGFDGALDFDGESTGVVINSPIVSGDMTFAAWIKPRNLPYSGGYRSIFHNNAWNGGSIHFHLRVNSSIANADLNGGGGIQTSGGLSSDTWYHIAVTVDTAAGTGTLYLNGVLDATSTGATAVPYIGPFEIGSYSGGARFFDGAIDDFRIYDTPLSQEDIQLIMRGDPTRAFGPVPSNGATAGIDAAGAISWGAGDIAVSHDVFFGTDEAAVKAAEVGDPEFLGNQAGTSKAIGAVMGQTYYWRIDERNNDASVTKGRVWRFTVAQFRIIDDFEDYGDGIVIGESGQRIWFVWWDGLGYENPVLKDGNLSNSTIDLSTGVADGSNQAMQIDYYGPGTSWVQAMTADLPISADWTAYGTKAMQLRFRGYDATQGSLTSTGGTSYEMTGAGADIWGAADQFHFAYVEMSTGPTTIQVKINSLVQTNGWAKCGVMVRDTLTAGSNHTFMCITPQSGASFQWRDVVDFAANNSVAVGGNAAADPPGHLTAPIWLKIDRNIGGLATGSYSLDGNTWVEVSGPNDAPIGIPMYVGVALTSHVAGTATTATFQDLTIDGVPVTGLLNTDIGITSNVPDNLYVELSDGVNVKQIAHPDNPNAVASAAWQSWDIALSDFAPVNPANVQKVTVGVAGIGGGDGGRLFVDNMRLYPSRFVADKVTPIPENYVFDGIVDLRDGAIMFQDWLLEDSSSPALVAQYTMENNANDVTGNGFNGTLVSGASFVASKAGFGMALDVNGVSDYIETDANASELGIGGGAPKTVSAWVYTRAFNNGGIFTVGAHANGRQFSLRTKNTGPNEWRAQNYGFPTYDFDFTYPTLDAWVHFAYVYDGGEVIVYANGAVVERQNIRLNTADSDSGVSSAHTFRIGRYGNSYFDGLIDDLRVYDKALTIAEVGSIMGGGAGSVSDYHPVASPMNFADPEAQGQRIVNFRDMAVFLDVFGEPQVWP